MTVYHEGDLVLCPDGEKRTVARYIPATAARPASVLAGRTHATGEGRHLTVRAELTDYAASEVTLVSRLTDRTVIITRLNGLMLACDKGGDVLAAYAEPPRQPAGSFSDMTPPAHESLDDGIEVIRARRSLEMENAALLRQVTAGVLGRHGSYDQVIDLTGTEFIDSTGIGVLVGVLKRVRQHDGLMAIAAGNDRILKHFRITGLTKVFTIRPTVAEAAAAIREQRT